MFCDRCGQRIKKDGKFCDNCGYRISSETTLGLVGLKGKEKYNLIGLLSIGIILLGGGISYGILGSQEEGSENTTKETITEEKLAELKGFQASTTETLNKLKQTNQELLEKNKELESKIANQQNSSTSQNEPSSDLSKNETRQIMSHIVQVVCQGDSSTNYGSGVIGKGGTVWTIYTNLHIVSAGSNTSCIIGVPTGIDFIPQDKVQASIERYSVDYWDIDFAILKTQDTGKYYANFPFEECHVSEVEVGDTVTIFGYPAIGGESQTVTEGIISGSNYTSYGPIYKTSAKIAQGNSGGIAIDNNSKCSIGIPTWSTQGEYEGLGHIQSWDMIRESISF